MNEEPHQPLEIFRRDRDHQLEWLEQHGTEVMDAVKLAYDSGLLSVVKGLDRAALDNALQAVVESGVATPKKSEAAEAAEGTEASGVGCSNSMDGIMPQFKRQATQKRGKKGKLSVDEKLAALDEWDKLDRDLHPIKLDDWLERKFGEDNGVLRVGVSTFHSWRKLRKT